MDRPGSASELSRCLGLAAVITLNPYLLLGYGAVQGLIIVGIILFIIVAVLSQRAMVLEEFYRRCR